MFLVTLKQDHFRNKKLLFPTPPFLDFKNSDIFTQFNKIEGFRHIWWLFLEPPMHQFSENMFLLSLKVVQFSNQKVSSSTLLLIDYKK